MGTDRHRLWTDTVTPLGKLTLTASERGLDGLFFPGRARGLAEEDRCPERFEQIVAQLDEYFSGTRRQFELQIDLSAGTTFQQAVWEQLLRIPYGETVSYSQIAGRLGGPERVRAVGAANGANPLSIIVPCHRVIGADGTLTGYGGGLQRKQALLDIEAAVTQGGSLEMRFAPRQLTLI